MAGGDVTYADIMMANLLAMMDKRHPGVMEKEAPVLHKHMAKVLGLPKFKEWITASAQNQTSLH